MKARFIWLPIGVAALLAAGFWVKCSVDQNRLNTALAFIESEYKPQLTLIEQEMRTKTNAYVIEVRQRVADAISLPEVFDATWSTDGHHGLERLSLNQTNSGYTIGGIIGLKATSGSHSLYYGRADGGAPLLVLVGSIASDWKRQYRLVFRQPAIEQKMKSLRVQPLASGSAGFRASLFPGSLARVPEPKRSAKCL